MSETTSLKQKLGVEPARPRVVAECVTLVDSQVKAKSGLGGVAVKGAYGTVKTIKKRFVPEVVDALLDEWLDQLDPYFDSWQSGASGSFAEYLTARSDEVAEDLLTVTDGRAAKTKHKTAAKLYNKMRGKAKANVVEAIPELGKLIVRHLAPAEAGAEGGADSDTTAA